MKKYTLLLFFTCLTQLSLAQIYFSYDQAGNRIKRNSVPDLTPVLFFQPTSIYSSAVVYLVADIYELNGVATSGAVTVKITRQPQLSLSFNPAATSVLGKPVQNASWSFDATSDPDYYTLTSAAGVAPGDLSSFGLTGTFSAGATAGQVTVITVVAPNGGETSLANNIATTQVTYFP